MLSILLVAFPVLASGTNGMVDGNAGEGPIKGIVWQPPSEARQASADLRQMAAIGVEAVRIQAVDVDEANHLPLADTLGLDVFVELPFSDLTASALSDSLATDSPWIAHLVRWIDTHRSVRHVGLAQRSDTGTARACQALSQFAGALRERSTSDIRVYYTSGLIRTDRCAAAVDFVLLDSRGTDPAARLAQWHRHQAGRPVGLAALGTRATTLARSDRHGLHSPSAQARALEDLLASLLTSERDYDVQAIFIYTWRDPVNVPRASTLREGVPRSVCCYGLLTAEGEPRPALEVVESFFTGTQSVFAFPAETNPASAPPWVILAGWLTLALLGAVYATSILFRRLLPRYVMAPGFYRESVREGRELPRRATFFLAGIAALAGGTTGAAILSILQDDPVVAWLITTSSEPASSMLSGFLEEPWLLVLALTAVSLLSIFLSAAVYILLSARRRRLSPAQGLTLVLWPRWPVFLLMLAAMVLTTLSPEDARAGAWLLAALWVILLLARTIRIVRDGTSVVPGARTIELVALSPLTPLVTFCALAAVLYASELAYVWRLLQESW